MASACVALLPVCFQAFSSKARTAEMRAHGGHRCPDNRTAAFRHLAENHERRNLGRKAADKLGELCLTVLEMKED
jgi:hypothetical protein